MHLVTAILLYKHYPAKHLQTEVNGCGVESIDIATLLEDIIATSPSRLTNEV